MKDINMKITLDENKYNHVAIKKLFEHNTSYERLEEAIIRAYELGYETGREAGYSAGFQDCLEFEKCLTQDVKKLDPVAQKVLHNNQWDLYETKKDKE